MTILIGDFVPLESAYMCADVSFCADPEDISRGERYSTSYHFCQSSSGQSGSYSSLKEFADAMSGYGIRQLSEVRNYPKCEEPQDCGEMSGRNSMGKHLFVQRGPVSETDLSKIEELLTSSQS